jgi:hypothetical protein
MIIFGSRSKIIEGQGIQGIACNNCESDDFHTFGVLKYFHVYWIPTFAFSKQPGIECKNCKNTLIGKEVPMNLSKAIKASVFTAGKLIPSFIGLILFSSLFLYVASLIALN